MIDEESNGASVVDYLGALAMGIAWGLRQTYRHSPGDSRELTQREASNLMGTLDLPVLIRLLGRAESAYHQGELTPAPGLDLRDHHIVEAMRFYAQWCDGGENDRSAMAQALLAALTLAGEYGTDEAAIAEFWAFRDRALTQWVIIEDQCGVLRCDRVRL